VGALGEPGEGPFNGRVTFGDVAERVRSIDLGDTPPSMRTAFARLLRGNAAGQPPAFARRGVVGGIEGLTVTPPGRREGVGDPRFVWFHGGGYVFGSPGTHARAAAALAARIEEPVFLPRYRLAPEHAWPTQRDDGSAVARALQNAGRDPVLVGDSAGGHLALVVALALAEEGRAPAALVLFSPNTDRTGRSATREVNTPLDPMNADGDDQALARMAFGDRSDDDPEVSPVLADLSRLPPTHVEVGDREVLLGDSQVLARRARTAGTDVSLHIEPGAFHMWQLWTPWLPAADASLDRAAAFLREWA
jgi:acetyl esterase/lipase